MGWMANATPRPLYPRERPGSRCKGGWVCPRAGLDGCGKRRPYRDSIPVPSSESLYRLSYPGAQPQHSTVCSYGDSFQDKLAFNNVNIYYWVFLMFDWLSKSALGVTHYCQMGTAGERRAGRESNHSPASSAEIKNVCSCSLYPIRLHRLVLSVAQRKGYVLMSSVYCSCG